MNNESSVKEILLPLFDSFGFEHHEGDVVLCPACGEPVKQYFRHEYEGHAFILPASVLCACERLERERERREAEQAELVRRRTDAFRYARFSNEYLSATLESWNDGSHELLRLAKAFIVQLMDDPAGSVGMTISGVSGLGKTRLLCALANKLIEMQVDVRYISIPHILTLIKAAYSDETAPSESRILGNVLQSKVLLLDELGLGKRSAWQHGILYELIDQARMSGTVIVAMTNLEQDKLRNYLREPETGLNRLYDRLLEKSPFITVEGKNYRERLEAESRSRLERYVSAID